MRFSKLIFILLTLGLISVDCKKDQTTESKFNGSWRLDKFESLDNNSGKWYYDSAFSGWTGYIIYDGRGHMGVEITPKGYKDFNANKNLDSLSNDGLIELVKLYKSNWVYFADYKVSGNTVEHKRLSATEPKDWGTTLTRDFEFKNDTLILIPHETLGGKKSRLWWVKM
ncbi:MAG: lipocalin-like domain-containing protein [Ignavibacteriae bacterium]|nr:lipocalin-like domain-containing protein [Ignavibacteriota bacterium]